MPPEIVGGHRQGQKLVDLIQSLHHHLADRADERAPAEALSDVPSPVLACTLTTRPCRLSVST